MFDGEFGGAPVKGPQEGPELDRYDPNFDSARILFSVLALQQA